MRLLLYALIAIVIHSYLLRLTIKKGVFIIFIPSKQLFFVSGWQYGDEFN